MPFIEVNDHQELQVGSFVKLEGSWFSHPFPTNTFKIKSAEDLAIIRELTNVRILHDPDRTNSCELEAGGPEDQFDLVHEAPTPVPDVTETPPDEGQQSGLTGSRNPESSPAETSQRREDYHEFQAHLRKVEKAYRKTLGQSHELFRQLSDRRPTGLNTADTMVSGILKALKNPKTAMSLMDVTGSNGVTWGLSEHALNVCTLSLIIGRQIGLADEDLLDLGRGALFHDVGYRALPMKVRFSGMGIKLQPDPEMDLRHPEVGCQLMASFSDPSPVILEMIGRHHERLDGSGYPGGIQSDDLSQLTKIIMVADYFDELCNAPDPRKSLSPHAALSRLFRHVVMKGESSRFCQTIVQALVQAIGVYPPGSLVELSDGNLGVVSLINLQLPTKPLVLLYAPWICRNDGMLVNLANEPELEITRAIHARDIPEPALAYLSPRRMAMFVHAAQLPTTGIYGRRGYNRTNLV